MSDVINLMKKAESVDVSPSFDVYSKVIVNISDDEQKSCGDEMGRTVEITNPLFGSQVPEKLLARLKKNAFQYQPLKAKGALLDPAAEIGDAISVNDVYGGIYNRDLTINSMMRADVEAPHDEEINHEYKFQTKQERKIKREIGEVRASLIALPDQIKAEVVAKEDGEESSFGWSLLRDAWDVYSNGTTVLHVDSNGLEVAGRIKTGTKIGSDDGFNISATAIWNGMNSLSSGSNGVYVGTDGISLGGGKFKVTSAGAVTASNLSITGGSISLGKDNNGNIMFNVTSGGVVTARSLKIQGGTISIGTNFSVNSSGNVTANNMSLKGKLTMYDVNGKNPSEITPKNLATYAGNGNSAWSGWSGATSGKNKPSSFFVEKLKCDNLTVVNSINTLSIDNGGLKYGSYYVYWVWIKDQYGNDRHVLATANNGTT